MATPGPFATWWSLIQARLGTSYRGDELHYFSDNQRGQFHSDRPPAILYELVEDDFGTDTGSRRGPGSAQADPLWNANTAINFHVFGKDPDDVHELRRALIAAIHDVGVGAGSYRLRGGTWDTGKVTSNGSAYVLHAALKIPITRDLEAKRVITQFDLDDYGLQQPGDNTP